MEVVQLKCDKSDTSYEILNSFNENEGLLNLKRVLNFLLFILKYLDLNLGYLELLK